MVGPVPRPPCRSELLSQKSIPLRTQLEAPTPVIKPEVRTPISEAIDHFLKLKQSKSRDTYPGGAPSSDFSLFVDGSRKLYGRLLGPPPSSTPDEFLKGLYPR